MKASCCLLPLLLLGSPVALAQGTAPPPDIADPASFGTKGSCLAGCTQVFADCKTQCENTRATARIRHFDTPDLPAGECIANCEEDLRLCKEDC
jgi:hypothetical protein